MASKSPKPGRSEKTAGNFQYKSLNLNGDPSKRNTFIMDIEDLNKNNAPFDGKRGDEIEKTLNTENCEEQLKPYILFWLFLEKCNDISIVFSATLILIDWAEIDKITLYLVFGLLLSISALSFIFLIFCSRNPGYKKLPKCLICKTLYVIFLISIFYFFAINVPISVPFFLPFMSLVPTITAALTYLFFALVAVSYGLCCKINTSGNTLLVLGAIMPVFVLAVSQFIFWFCRIGLVYNVELVNFTANVLIGVAMSLPFSCDGVFIFQTFGDSGTLEKFLKTKGLIPGFVLAFYDLRCENTHARYRKGETRNEISSSSI